MKYSVIIPTQNRPDLVVRALRSVHAQTSPAAEIIVIDDASTPPLILPEYLCDKRTRVVRVENAVGGAAARNIGLDSATSPYVAFLDDDDEWLPRKMEKQMTYFFSHPEAVLVSCGHHRNEGGCKYDEVFSEDFVKLYRNYDNYFGSFSFLVIKRTEHRLNPVLPSLQDWDFALRVTQSAQFGILEEPLAIYHGHDQPRITNRRMNRLKGLRMCYQKHRFSFSKDERRWWLSQIVFERSLYITDPKLRKKRVALSITLGACCDLPLPVKIRSITRKAASHFVNKETIVAIRSYCLSSLQRHRSFLTRQECASANGK